jgi:hypothetical protein
LGCDIKVFDVFTAEVEIASDTIVKDHDTTIDGLLPYYEV